MKLLAVMLLAVTAAATFAQTDHDNLDRGRPLSFEDAEPMARGGYAFEFGLNSNLLRRGGFDFSTPFALVWGVAANTQLEIGSSLRFGRSLRGVDVSDSDLGLLYSFNREIGSSPAFAAKLETSAERGRTTTLTAMGIASKTIGAYDRLHVNASLAMQSGDRPRPGLVLGFTRPLGYPRHFDTTGLAEIGIVDLPGGTRTIVGLGIRHQLNPRDVLDLGIESEITGSDRVPLRLILGYSTSF